MTRFIGVHEGRVAVVTGAAGGIGRAYAERLARDGANVVIADLKDGAETARAIEANGGTAIAVTCDVASESAVAGLRESIYRRFGQCDILVNNAAVTTPVPWDELDFAEWRRVLAINLDSMFLTCKAFAPGMRDTGFGRIVNISSATVGVVVQRFVHYTASKAGVVGITRALASELGADGITVNCVMPGLTRTAQVEADYQGTSTFEDVAAAQAIKRSAVPADLEATISFLATEDARWITGQTIVVDGGYLRH